MCMLGVATITQFVDVTTKVVGMGPDLALFLAVLGGLLASGDLVHWSIVCVDQYLL